MQPWHSNKNIKHLSDFILIFNFDDVVLIFCWYLARVLMDGIPVNKRKEKWNLYWHSTQQSLDTPWLRRLRNTNLQPLMQLITKFDQPPCPPPESNPKDKNEASMQSPWPPCPPSRPSSSTSCESCRPPIWTCMTCHKAPTECCDLHPHTKVTHPAWQGIPNRKIFNLRHKAFKYCNLRFLRLLFRTQTISHLSSCVNCLVFFSYKQVSISL